MIHLIGHVQAYKMVEKQDNLRGTRYERQTQLDKKQNCKVN